MRKPVDVDLVKAEVDTTPKFQRREIATLAPIVDGVDVDTEVLRQFVTLNHRREVVGCHGHGLLFVACNVSSDVHPTTMILILAIHQFLTFIGHADEFATSRTGPFGGHPTLALY